MEKGDAGNTGLCGSHIAFRVVAAAAALLAGGTLASGAAAQDVFSIVGGGTVLHDANVFRLPASVDPASRLGASGKSDTITSAYVGLRLDKPYSLQRFQLSITQTESRYHRFAHLNFEATDYRAAWLWSLTPRVSGALRAEREQGLVPFANFQGFQRNVRITENRAVSIDASIGAGWHLLTGATHTEQRTSAPFLAEADYQLLRGDFGARYDAASGSSLTVLRRTGRGDYAQPVVEGVAQVDNDFRQDEDEVAAHWVMTGRSSLRARATQIARRHYNFRERNFSARGAELGYSWASGGKLSFAAAVKRDIAPFFDNLSTFRTDDTFSLLPLWQATARTAMQLRFEYVRSAFQGITSPAPHRADRAQLAALNVQWAPTRTLTVSAGLQRQERSSNYPDFEFDTSVATLGMSLRF